MNIARIFLLWRRLLAASVPLLLSIAATRGQTPPAAASASATARAAESTAKPLNGHSAHGSAFDAGPRQKPWVMTGIGHAPFPITTKNPEVQTWFDQGNALLHSFDYYDAERAFRWCVKLEPENAMAYWGLAVATEARDPSGQVRAADFLRVRLLDNGSERAERDYVDLTLGGPANDAFRLERFIGWSHESLAAVSPGRIEPGAWHKLAIDVTGGEVVVASTTRRFCEANVACYPISSPSPPSNTPRAT